ncbi:MAG: M12 family metallo-peptidase [Pyrinomonadaceae bacterium]
MKFNTPLRLSIVVCLGFLLLMKLSFSVQSAKQNERASPSGSSGARTAKPILVVEPQLSSGERGIERALKSYGLLKLDAGQLSEQVRQSGKLTLRTERESFDLDMEENNLLSADYRAEEVAEGGRVRAVPRPEVHTYKGKVNNRSDTQARLTIAPQTFEGVIIAAGETYFIEPRQKHAESGEAREFLFYKESDVIERDAAGCGVTLGEKINHAAEGVAARHLKDIPERSLAESDGQLNREIELATEADFEYVTATGTSGAANARIISIMNMVEGIFQDQLGLSFTITYQHSWATDNDPYHSTVPSTVLTEFQNYWNNNYASINRDLAHMWTGKDLDDDTAGIAFVGVTCRSLDVSYGVSQRIFSTDAAPGITAHEIGHNLGATHPNERVPPIESCATSIMDQMGSNYSSFCQFSVDEMRAYVSVNPSCLTPTFIISGQVTGAAEGNNTTMVLTGPRPSALIAYLNGKFSFPGLTAGTYTITPSQPGYTFNPPVQTITVSNAHVSDVVFTAIVLTYQVTGRVADMNNRGVGGVDIDLTGRQNDSLTVKTNPDGSYIFENLLATRGYTLSARDGQHEFTL